jgi:hypothetical protein
VRQTVLQLYSLLEARFAIDLYLLGDDEPISIAWLQQQHRLEASLSRRTACSLITPTLGALLRGGRKRMHAVVLVGNGSIFDMADWLDEPRVERWVAVQVGNESLCTHDRVLTWSHKKIDDIIVGINGAALGPQRRTTAPELPPYRVPAVSWELDRTGFPLIRVDALGDAYAHLFPVAKAQFECYLAQPRVSLGDNWYEEQILAKHPRGELNAEGSLSTASLFMTGLLLEEVALFRSWMGSAYRLMTAEEWGTYYTWLKAIHFLPEPPAVLISSLNRYAAKLWVSLCQRTPLNTFATVAIGLPKLLEVTVNPSHAKHDAVRWMGQSGLIGATRGVRPVNPDIRNYHVGFRLVTTRVS